MSRSKKNWDELVDFEGNYYDLDKNVGVGKLIAGDDIVLNPPGGFGTVTISVDKDGDVVMKGNAISELDNDAGYLSEVENLNDIGDVNVPAPTVGQVLQWNGSEWVNKTLATPDSFLYRGRRNVEVDFPEPDVLEGYTYIQEGASGVTPNAAWVGIETETVDELDLIVYSSGGWTVVKGVFDVISFQDLNAANADDPQSGEPGGYLDYDPATATFTLYPADLSLLPDPTDPLAQDDTLDERYVLKSGDTMTGALNLSDSDLEDAKNINLSGNLELTNTGSVNAEGNLQLSSFGERGAYVYGVKGGGEAHLFLDKEPTNDRHAASKLYVDTAVLAIADDSDDSYVAKDGDTMTGSLTFDNVGNAIELLGSSTINVAPGKSMNFKVDNQLRLTITENSVLVKNKPFRIQALDNSYVIESRPGDDLDTSHARYMGKIDNQYDITNKKYVDDADADLESAIAAEISRLDSAIDNRYTKGESDDRYLYDVEVKETITGGPGTEALVEVSEKNKFTFTIPTGAEGQTGGKGDKGDKGTRGPSGADGTSITGEKGATGAQGTKGEPGTNGSKGDTGIKGQKGQKGASSDGKYVTRGNSGVDMRIWYSNNRYYIAGTS